MRRLALCLACLFGLSACIDADLMLDFKDAEAVETTIDLRMSRDAHALVIGRTGFCRDGRATVDAGSVTCREQRVTTVQDLLEASATGADGGPEAMLRRAERIERLDERRLRVTLDLAALSGSVPELREAQAMAGLMRSMLAGHDLTFRVRAPVIEETTGTLLPDGCTAEYVLPLATALGGTPPAPFVTTLALRGCFLWVFC